MLTFKISILLQFGIEVKYTDLNPSSSEIKLARNGSRYTTAQIHIFMQSLKYSINYRIKDVIYLMIKRMIFSNGVLLFLFIFIVNPGARIQNVCFVRGQRFDGGNNNYNFNDHVNNNND